MKCRQVQELLMTDYSDGQISEELKTTVEEHVKLCKECQRFGELLQEEAIDPFKRVEKVRPPQSLWYKIKEAIEVENRQQLATNPIIILLGKFKSIIHVPKPVLASATIVVVALIVLIFMQPQLENGQMISEYLEEQAEFLASLGANAENMDNGDYVNFGTALEEHFL
ncbi:MAG: zf-HC2 domain-containing protein [Candidatus Omnitrophota bacterium]|nr:MAG: zf-HC2 domain-containing protein [Candidatus Omnitrophota bacterium]